MASDADSSSSPLMRNLGNLLLGLEPAQRVRLMQNGFAMLLMACSVGVVQLAVYLVGLPQGPMAWWGAASLCGMLMIYAAIRSGWSLRFSDPSLTVPQMAYAVSIGAIGYTLGGPIRAIAFPILMIILMFGMFQLRARSALGISLYALASFGLAMGLMAAHQPWVYVPGVELAHFLMLIFMVPAVSVLAGRLSRIRRRLTEQKLALTEALAQIQAMATRDDLTGLMNRRHMQTLLEQETQRCLRNGHGYCLALLDIDHFKQINDSHGHAAGDTMLRAFAVTAQGAIRGTDVLARWGGEEFVLMLADTRMPPALGCVERLRQGVEALSVACGDQQVRVTVSAGITEHRLGDKLVQTLERADKLLYAAKANGRNQVVSG